MDSDQEVYRRYDDREESMNLYQQYINTKKNSRLSYQTARGRKKEIEERFDIYIRQLRNQENDAFLHRMIFSGMIVERRKAALAHYIEELPELFPNLEIECPERELLLFEIDSDVTYEMLNDLDYMLLAAAIWILPLGVWAP